LFVVFEIIVQQFKFVLEFRSSRTISL